MDFPWSAYGASDRQDVYRASQLSLPMDDTGLDSRVFVVCGKSVEVRSVGGRVVRLQCRNAHGVACMRTGPHLPIHARHARRRTFSRRRLHRLGRFRASSSCVTRAVRNNALHLGKGLFLLVCTVPACRGPFTVLGAYSRCAGKLEAGLSPGHTLLCSIGNLGTGA